MTDELAKVRRAVSRRDVLAARGREGVAVAVLAAVEAGFSYRQIADAAGLSFQRVGQIVNEAKGAGQ